ncbi:hypothetical protein COLO4_17117 [Corchorus olitorius]|uniref:Uncharacterized protein n=1 Tax=Corchorus olitorius TaxID=93759 RepID=A0A1R3JE57_9ROSI|nr:hypothetical protein COLO4_17117 [Corchorus olitorius]
MRSRSKFLGPTMRAIGYRPNGRPCHEVGSLDP